MLKYLKNKENEFKVIKTEILLFKRKLVDFYITFFTKL